ncbi:MAG: hypothetical protein WC479_05905 [Candidatus Izemoplasmatales bacterium]
MVDNPDLIEMSEIEIWRLIEIIHRQGLSYWHILRILPRIFEGLMMKADAEYHLKGGQ